MINPRKLKDEVIENISHRSSIIQLPGEENGAKEISALYIIQPCATFKCDITLKVDLLQVPHEETQDIVGMNSDSDVWPKISRPARGTCTLQAVMNN